MECTVLRSDRKDFTYIYLKEGCEFDDLPHTLRKVFGDYRVVMMLSLTAERKLAYEDVSTVMKNLTEHGYHLQMPPQEDATGLLELPEKKKTLF